MSAAERLSLRRASLLHGGGGSGGISIMHESDYALADYKLTPLPLPLPEV